MPERDTASPVPPRAAEAATGAAEAVDPLDGPTLRVRMRRTSQFDDAAAPVAVPELRYTPTPPAGSPVLLPAEAEAPTERLDGVRLDPSPAASDKPGRLR